MPSTLSSTNSAVAIAMAASAAGMLYLRLANYKRKIHSSSVVPAAREIALATVKNRNALPNVIQDISIDVPGSLRAVYEAYFEEIWRNGGGYKVIVHDDGNQYGEGLVRSVPIPVGGLVETIVDCVPYVRVQYAVAFGLASLGCRAYSGETRFELVSFYYHYGV